MTAAPPGPPPGFLAVVNASAGAAGSASVRRVVRVLEAAAPVELAATAGAGDLDAVLARLAGRRLVVLGGDGSVHTVVRRLHAAGSLEQAGPVGIVPMGTGNDLARTLGLPLGDPEAAARVVIAGRALPNELVVETSGDDVPMVAVNAAHAGIGVSATLRAQKLKPYLGRAAYPVGALGAGALGGPWRLRVVVDGAEVHDGREPVVIVALSIGRTIGGGAPLSPDSSPHDGLVDVVVSTGAGIGARARYAVTMLRGRSIERRDVARVRGRDVTVEAVDGDPFVVNADGELTEARRSFAWTTLHDAWSALVPVGAPGAAPSPVLRRPPLRRSPARHRGRGRGGRAR